MSVKSERKKTAEFRFYLYVPVDRRKSVTWMYLVCDGNHSSGTSAIGKFRDKESAELFLDARRKKYVDTGE